MLGFTEKEVGHMTLKKWSLLYKHFRAYHNFCTQQQLFKDEKQTFEGHRLQPIIYTTLYYGLRCSEAIGLKWDAVDFKNDKFKINHTIVQSLIIEAKDKAKTVSSTR